MLTNDQITTAAYSLLQKHNIGNHTLLHLVTVGSRYYRYNSENSDYDIVGVYNCENRPSLHFNNSVTGYVDNIVEKVIIDGYTIEFSLYDIEKWLYLLANNSLNICESLFNYMRIVPTKLSISMLQRLYVKHFSSGLIYNLLNFSHNCYIDYVCEKTDSVVFGMNKHLFYSKFRMYQAIKLLDLFSTIEVENVQQLRFRIADIFSDIIFFDGFEEFCETFSIEMIDELKERTKSIPAKLSLNRHAAFYDTLKVNK